MEQEQHDDTTEHGDRHLPESSLRRTALGVTAGLVAGGAIGLFAAAPTFSSAATPDAELVQATTEDTTGADATADAADAPTGDRVRELLQPLVDDGTIDSGQADAVASHLAGQRLDRRSHRSGPRHPGFDGEIVAELLDTDAESLREQLRDGASIADVAEASGVDPQTVIDALVDEAGSHLDAAVDSGRLTADEAAERADQLEERITAGVNGERPGRPATN